MRKAKANKKAKAIKKLQMSDLKKFTGGGPGPKALCTGGYIGHESGHKTNNTDGYNKTL
jgi:hypothetical protein